jgi:hypothetical protein
MMSWPGRIISELDACDRRAERIAKGLGAEQLNWQPSRGAWSVGQCLEHLCNTNEIYLPPIEAALEGNPLAPVPEIRLGMFSRWFIRNYIAPNPGGARSKAPKKIEPAPSVKPDILDRFLRSNEGARDLVRRAAGQNVNSIRFRNPFLPILRFTVGTGLEIIAQHQGRHLLQAEGVEKSAGFPL